MHLMTIVAAMLRQAHMSMKAKGGKIAALQDLTTQVNERREETMRTVAPPETIVVQRGLCVDTQTTSKVRTEITSIR